MGFRIHRGIFQKLNAERTAYENTFKIDDDGRIKEVDSEGNVTLGYLKVGEQASDADTVDGIHAGSFLRSDASDTYTGGNLVINSSGQYRVFHAKATRAAGLGTGSAGSNTPPFLFENAGGDQAWGVVAEFRINEDNRGGDSPAILFSDAQQSTQWTVGFDYTGSEFGIRKNRGIYSGGWGTSYFKINTSGKVFIPGELEVDSRVYADNGLHVRGDWLRVDGQNGIYFESYGGGWRMTDTSWIRAYNDKNIYTGGNIEVGGTIRANGNGFYVDSTNVINSAGKFIGNIDNSETKSDYFIQEAHGNPRNNLGSPTVTEMALFDSQFRCMTDLSNNYTNLDRLTFWVQQNEGDEWTEVTHSDTNKKRFLRTNSSGVVIPNRAYKFRVEFKAPGYVFANALYFYWSSNSHSTKVHVYKYNASQDTWHAHATSNTNVSSWPGHLYLPFSTIPWHETHTTSTGHHRYIRVEFIPNWSTGSYADRNINLYGGQIWGGYPSGRRTVHSINEDGNYYFPANLYAEGGSGDGSRLATRDWVGSNTLNQTEGDARYLQSVPSTYATTSYVDTAVSNLVDSAPGALNTLNELAAALGDDANFSTTVTNAIAAKADASHGHSSISTITVTNQDDAVPSNSTFSAYLAQGSGSTTTAGGDGAILSTKWSGGDYVAQLYYDVDPTNVMAFRGRNSSGWGRWNTVWHDGNLSNVSQLTNDAGYLTSVPSEYLTQTEGDARYLQSLPSHNHDSLYHKLDFDAVTSAGRPDAESGTWTKTVSTTDWGSYKVGTDTDAGRAYNDAPGYVEYNIPSGYSTAYIGQLKWSSGGYFDVYAKKTDGSLVHRGRYLSKQSVEHSSHGGDHDGQQIIKVSGLDGMAAIRITNRVGRVHLQGIGWTKELDTDGTQDSTTHWDLINGKPSTFAPSSHNHDSRYYTETESDARYLGISAKAADANLLDGVDSSRFVYGGNSTRTTNISNFSTALNSGFYDGYNATGNPTSSWYTLLNMRHNNTGNNYGSQIAVSFYSNADMYVRTISNGTYQGWSKIWNSANLSTTKISNWDTAYGWGDHSTQGYLDAVPEEYKTQTQNDARYAAIAHNHSGVYDPAGTAQSVSDELSPRITAVETSTARNATDLATKANISGSYNQDFNADDMYVDQWFRNTVSGKGLYNQATTQHWYSDHDDYWNIAGGSSANGIRFRDEHGGTIRGYVYATNNNEVGFLDAGASWAIRHTNDWGTRFYTDGSTEEFRVGRDAVTGNYGTVETKTTRSSWGGYSINGRVVFMHDHGNWWGIYNDVNNEWMIRGELNGRVELRHNSATKLETTSSGVTVTGTVTATAFAGDGSALTGISAGAPPVQATVEGGEASTLASIHFSPGEGAATFTLADGQTFRLAFAR